MRSILVLAGGRHTDSMLFDTALAAARPLGAHMEFLYVRIDAAEAAVFTPHLDFAVARTLRVGLADLEREERKCALAAERQFKELCTREGIRIATRPEQGQEKALSASWSTLNFDATANIVNCARHNDLVVLRGRPLDGWLPPALLEQVLMGSGRPILIAPDKPRRRLTGTVLVCWKETAESARALAAALPLLAASDRVVIASMEEGPGSSPEALYHLAERLEWNEIHADPRWLRASPEPVADRLERLAINIGADLLVMGGYGHGRLRETVFGGCTRHFLDRCDRPVLMMH
jgi:nucleotide-binding universal stress UspA family protein